MNRFYKFMSRMSLTQQLMLIVIFMLALFIFFSAFLLNQLVDRFANQQMYEMIHRSQENVIYNYRQGVDEENLFGAGDPYIIHIIRRSNNEILSNGLDRVDNELLNQIKIQMDPSADLSVDYVFNVDGSLYTITAIDRNTSIATLIMSSYSNNFKDVLVNNIINIIMLFMGIVSMILLIWVSYLIHPLNQIRDYINKRRSGEKPELKIDRYDEIGEVARMLVAMNDEISRQQRSKEEMIQNISHDLKTPIATIKSYGESIKDGVYPYETLEKSVDVIIEHAQRLENKVHSLLMLNRMEYLTTDPRDFVRVNLQEVVEWVIVSSSMIRPDLDIRLEAEEENFVSGNEEPWRVVIENLLDNAMRYAKTEIVMQLDNDYFSIFNDGRHIDESRMDSLFNAYEKGERGQFGLGLSIVHRVLSNYGYKIEVHNVKNGVQFEIYGGRV